MGVNGVVGRQINTMAVFEIIRLRGGTGDGKWRVFVHSDCLIVQRGLATMVSYMHSIYIYMPFAQPPT
jgi:hypothetical protein